MLILICGLPRAGKTTYSLRYDNVIHCDGLGYHRIKDLASQTIGDIVVDGIYNDVRTRSRLVEAYQGQGKKCIWLDTPLEVRKTRPMWQPYYGLFFEPPTLDEGWDEIITIRGDKVESINRQREA